MLSGAIGGALAQYPSGPALESEPEAGRRQQDSGRASQQDAAPEQENSPALLPDIQGIEAPARDLIAKENEAARQRQEEREKSDLKAQEKVARWTFWMSVAAFASVFLTAVGVVLIWRTLTHTRRAADAAHKIIAVTRDLGIRQMRAYVNAYDIRVSNFVPDMIAVFSVTIRNTGATLAYEANDFGRSLAGQTDLMGQLAFLTERHFLLS